MFSTVPRTYMIVCDGCHYPVGCYLECDIQLNINHKGNYIICSGCINKTIKELEKIKKLPFDELPLYINHDNTFIQEAIKKRLNQEI